jgi:pimeloyl-ACP methyl ester carboxylesterase
MSMKEARMDLDNAYGTDRRGDGEFVEVGGRRLYLSVTGDGPPILLINGIGGSVSNWSPLLAGLGGMTTIAFDAPGSGRSPSSSMPISIPGMARLCTRLLDELGVNTTSVLGFSLGGLIAQQLAVTAPERVGRLVLMSTSFGWGSFPSDVGAMRGLLSLRRLYDPAHYARVAPALLGGRMRHDTDLVMQAAYGRVVDPPNVRGYLWQLLSCTTWSGLPRLSRIQSPTLLIVGDDDPLARVINARCMARMIPESQLYIVRGAGHHLLLERPDEIGGVVRGFLEGADPLGPAIDPVHRA